MDFDPVRAKADTLANGGSETDAILSAMSVISGKSADELAIMQQNDKNRYDELWQLAESFPSGFDNDVPSGWEVKKVGDIVKKIPIGKKYSQKTVFPKGNIPVLDQGKSGLIGYHNEQAGVIASIENPIIVFANHTCYMRLISYDFSAIQNVFAFKGENLDTYWVYLATLGKQEFTEYKGHFPDFLIKEIIVPNNNLDKIFGELVKFNFHQIFTNDKENEYLANIRDELLPKLLSGEIEL